MHVVFHTKINFKAITDTPASEHSMQNAVMDTTGSMCLSEG